MDRRVVLRLHAIEAKRVSTPHDLYMVFFSSRLTYAKRERTVAGDRQQLNEPPRGASPKASTSLCVNGPTPARWRMRVQAKKTRRTV